MNCRPDVLIVQDRSGSMTNDPGDRSCAGGCAGNSKWAIVSTAITNVVGTTDGIVNWGIKFFSDTKVCSASGPPTVGIGASTGAMVANAIARTLPNGNTPTRDAITYATAYLQSLADSNPKFLLLATDGLPNCPAGCADLTNPSNSCTMTDNPTEDMAAEAAVTMAASQGIKTFVIGIGALPTAENTLNQLAIAGDEAQTGAATSYYAAGDESALETALTDIVHKITGCPH
ncbi:MAG TPA: vWA domain-containing protein [Polyangia bacterium]|nr:vWA domain-containing protein [Polyangia bacterium]